MKEMKTDTKKRFLLVDIENREVDMELQSSTPREAALKAATRDRTLICLAEVTSGKLHVFRGDKVPLETREVNRFTQGNNIVSKPRVSKLGYLNLQQRLSRADVPRIADEFNRMTS